MKEKINPYQGLPPGWHGRGIQKQDSGKYLPPRTVSFQDSSPYPAPQGGVAGSGWRPGVREKPGGRLPLWRRAPVRCCTAERCNKSNLNSATGNIAGDARQQGRRRLDQGFRSRSPALRAAISGEKKPGQHSRPGRVRGKRRLSGNLFLLPAEPTFPELEIHAVDNRNDEQAEDGGRDHAPHHGGGDPPHDL